MSHQNFSGGDSLDAPNFTPTFLKCLHLHKILAKALLKFLSNMADFDWLMQGERNSIANALELRLSCTDPVVSARKM